MGDQKKIPSENQACFNFKLQQRTIVDLFLLPDRKALHVKHCLLILQTVTLL